MTKDRRPVGRPPMTNQERATREQVIDTHLNLPISLVEAIDQERDKSESRKDCIVRLLRERLERRGSGEDI